MLKTMRNRFQGRVYLKLKGKPFINVYIYLRSVAALGFDDIAPSLNRETLQLPHNG